MNRRFRIKQACLGKHYDEEFEVYRFVCFSPGDEVIQIENRGEALTKHGVVDLEGLWTEELFA